MCSSDAHRSRCPPPVKGRSTHSAKSLGPPSGSRQWPLCSVLELLACTFQPLAENLDVFTHHPLLRVEQVFVLAWQRRERIRCHEGIELVQSGGGLLRLREETRSLFFVQYIERLCVPTCLAPMSGATPRLHGIGHGARLDLREPMLPQSTQRTRP